jgi:hypothetical protein
VSVTIPIAVGLRLKVPAAPGVGREIGLHLEATVPLGSVLEVVRREAERYVAVASVELYEARLQGEHELVVAVDLACYWDRFLARKVKAQLRLTANLFLGASSFEARVGSVKAEGTNWSGSAAALALGPWLSPYDRKVVFGPGQLPPGLQVRCLRFRSADHKQVVLAAEAAYPL